jgi:hypothetical protein
MAALGEKRNPASAKLETIKDELQPEPNAKESEPCVTFTWKEER